MTAKRRILTTLTATALALGFTLATAGIASADDGSDISGSLADKATQVHMRITNNTPDYLYLYSSERDGSSAHWQDQPQSTLAPGANETVSSYAALNAEINLDYLMGDANGPFVNPAHIKLHAKTPSVGSNEASGSSTDPGFSIDADHDGGYNPTSTYSIQPGGTFTYTGNTQTYTVPQGVHQLKVTAVGGSGGYSTQLGHADVTTGAQVSGILAVEPGEVLTIGAAGVGHIVYNNISGGWGLTAGNDDFSGGDGGSTSVGNAGGGGGASVILDGSGTPVVVAGGGGGSGSGGSGCGTSYDGSNPGGKGGYNGSWAGQNGFPWPGGGGQAGAADTTRGQSQTAFGSCTGGAGGGGAQGGLAGATGNSAGGGAGSSSASGLTGATVTTAAQNGGNPVPGWVTLGPAG